uniref:Solute carrier family 22 member 16 n=1 Tax=Sphaeramia orbicularis TaxID=375764 RepID=A0A673AHB3_9TELE
MYFAAVFQAIACGIHYLASVFLVETPNFVCGVPDNITDVLYGNVTGSSLEEVLTVRGDQWELGRCQRALRTDPTDFTYEFDGNKSVKACDGTFVYDHSEVQQSIVTDWDLVCEKEWLAKLCQPTFMLGVLIGAWFGRWGYFYTRPGPHVIIFSSFSCLLSPQYVFPCCCCPSDSISIDLQVSSGYLVVVFVYVTEFTGIKVRTWTSMHVHAAFAVGIMVVALTGYLVRIWWIYQIILSTCTSPFLLFCWKFPETPFYLMAKGRYKETQTLIDTIARVNGIESRLKAEDLLEPEEQNGVALLQKEEQMSKPEKKLSILDLFGSWRMAGRTCCYRGNTVIFDNIDSPVKHMELDQ